MRWCIEEYGRNWRKSASGLSFIHLDNGLDVMIYGIYKNFFDIVTNIIRWNCWVKKNRMNAFLLDEFCL